MHHDLDSLILQCRVFLDRDSHTHKKAKMFSSKTSTFAVHLALLLVAATAVSADVAHGGVVPLNSIPSDQWIENVVGDYNKPGLPFVIRIHHDAGYVVFPHTHPEDENITILKGSWALGMGPRIVLSELAPMDLGAFGFVPKNMAHFGYAKDETIAQVHGIGPFINRPIDPAYQLTDKGVLFKTSLLKPGVSTQSSPPECFKLKVGARVHGARGDGMVVGALCSPANQFTQYWIQKPSTERFWATLQDLTLL